MKNNVYLPLQVVKRITDDYPGCWDMVQLLRSEFAEDFPAWCYIPIGACQAITEKITGQIDIADSMLMAACAGWRQNKSVYKFDEDMEQILFAQAEDSIQVPASIFNRMPYSCIYIETKTLPMHGFFVHREYDVNTKDEELRLVIVKSDGSAYGIPMHILEGKTVSQCMGETYSRVKSNGIDLPADGMQDVTNQIAKLLQLVIYVCAENADMTENPVQAKIYRRDKTVKDAFREIRQWDVGYKIGSLARASRASASSQNPSTSGSGSSKRPHPRRGHWSHYHVGPGRTETIVKWIAPTFVNAEKVDVDNMPVTITKIDRG